MASLMTEVQLAEEIVRYLEEYGWDVYQEVQIRSYGPIADIVAVQNKLVAVIEVKKSLGIQVIVQVLNWRPYANYLFVATPHYRQNYKQNVLLKDILKWQGIGSLKIGGYDTPVREDVKANLNRKALSNTIKSKLREEHKTFAKAGNADGRRFTPFQKTCLDIVKKVMDHPGICLKDLVDGINTHYSSPSIAKSCISRYAQEGIIKGIRCVKEGKLLRFYKDKTIPGNKGNLYK